MQCLILSGVTVLLDLAACRRERLSVNLIFAANAFGFAQQVPSEQVASVLMPTSPPSTLPPSTSLVALLLTVSVATSISSSVATSVATEGMSPVGASSSTSTDTNQRPARSRIVACVMRLSVGRQSCSFRRTTPMRGNWMHPSNTLMVQRQAPSPCLRVLRLGNSIRSPLRSPFLRTRQLSTAAWRLRSAS